MNIIKAIKDATKGIINWNWALVVFLLILGIVFVLSTRIALYYHDREVIAGIADKEPSALYNLWIPFLEKLGYIILSAGFFTAFTKSFHFIGLFKQELKNVLSEEDVITKQKLHAILAEEGILTKNNFTGELDIAVKSDSILMHSKNELNDILFAEERLSYATREYKKKIWKNITYSLYDPSFPDIDEMIVDKLLKFYVPEKLDYIYKDYIVKYDIKEVNENHVSITQNLSFDIIPGDCDITLKRKYFVWKQNNNSDDISNIEIMNFKIDGEECNTQFVRDEVVNESYKIISSSFEKSLPKKEIKIRSYIKAINTTKFSPHWRWKLGRITKNFHISVNNLSPDKFDVHLELTDERLKLEDTFLSLPKFDKRTNDLLFPDDGYIIIINRIK